MPITSLHRKKCKKYKQLNLDFSNNFNNQRHICSRDSSTVCSYTFKTERIKNHLTPIVWWTIWV